MKQMITKKNIKKAVLGIRDRLSPTEIQSLSRQIFDKVFSLDCYKNAKSVFIYNSSEARLHKERNNRDA
jgi:5-formyltetrahydrofolate cyclo-ligase